jgi:hypothetical protein
MLTQEDEIRFLNLISQHFQCKYDDRDQDLTLSFLKNLIDAASSFSQIRKEKSLPLYLNFIKEIFCFLFQNHAV